METDTLHGTSLKGLSKLIKETSELRAKNLAPTGSTQYIYLFKRRTSVLQAGSKIIERPVPL